MAKRWRIQAHDSGNISRLEKAVGVSPVLAKLLICRGIHDPHHARQFLDARLSELRDPSLLPGVPDAVERIYDATERKQRITVYGDYDADGMTGSAILVRCLQLLGADVNYYVPQRLTEGYGLNAAALEKLKSRGTKLVITVDCGIASVTEADSARELDLELIVTDHHELSDRLPEAAAIVHPRIPGQCYPFGGLCGAGVAFKLAWALCQRAEDTKRVSPRLKQFLVSAMGLAAIGTVADVVPLLDENRLIVRHGLASIKSCPPTGLGALLAITKLDSKPSLASEDIAFSLAPRLNAAGRLGQAQLGIELLTTDSQERAQALAEYIQQLNGNRETLERSVYLAANKQAKEQFRPMDDPALVLAGRGWHAGVIGIVAGRLAEKYSRPVVLIALDELGRKIASGSARSANRVNLHAALSACTDLLESHGGHAAAAGFRIDESHIDIFRAHFCEHVLAETHDRDMVAEIQIDTEASFSQLSLKIVQQIEQLAPFGHANPRPILSARNVRLNGPPKRIGGGDRHLSARLSQFGTSLRAVAFGQGEWADELKNLQAPIDVAFRPVINEFRGMRNVELHLVDWRVNESAVA